VALIVFTVLFLGPLQVYLGNSAEFSVTLTLYAAVHFGLALLATLVLSALFWILPRGVTRVLLPLAFGVGVMLYIQGNFLLWNYGLLDGREIDWSQRFGTGVFEAVIWLIVLGISIRFRSALLPYIARTSLALLAIQCVVTGIDALGHKPLPHQLFQIDGQSLESFSSEENAILIVVDAFQTTTFEEIIQQDPSFTETAYGFTYFNNAVSGYSKTLGSIPNILTGTFNLNEKPVADYIEEAFTGSLFETLREHGYRVEVYPWVDKTVLFSPTVADNIIPRGNLDSAIRSAPFSIDLSLFRHVPHFIKPVIYRGQRWFLSTLFEKSKTIQNNLQRLSKTGGVRDREFLDRMTNLNVSEEADRVFKYIHLQGPHSPFFLNEDLTFKKLPNNQEGYRSQARASARILHRFLQLLQKADLYDNSTIMIVADHGGGEYNVTFEDTSKPGTKNSKVSASDIAGGLPLVLVKPRGARDPWRVSNSPVAGGDTPKTLATLLKIPNQLPGRSMLDISESEPRERFHYHYSFDGWDKRYLPELTEYRILGDSHASSSWSPTGRVIEPGQETVPAEAVASNTSEGLRPNIRYKFGTTGNANHILTNGWDKPAAGNVRTIGPMAEMIIPVEEPTGALKLSFTVTPMIRAEVIPFQFVEILHEDQLLTSWKVSVKRRFAVAVPGELCRQGKISLRFNFPNATSPAQLGESGDQRRFALAFHDIEISPVHPLPEDGRITCNASGNLALFAGSGWATPERRSTWGVGHETSVIFDFPNGTSADTEFELKAKLSPILVPSLLDSNPVTVLFNNTPVAEWNLKGFGAGKVMLTVNGPGPATVTFRPAATAVPAEYNPDSKDVRSLSILFSEISVTPVAPE